MIFNAFCKISLLNLRMATVSAYDVGKKRTIYQNDRGKIFSTNSTSAILHRRHCDRSRSRATERRRRVYMCGSEGGERWMGVLGGRFWGVLKRPDASGVAN